MLCSFLDRFRVGQTMIDLAFAGANALRVNTGFREELKMCLPLSAPQVEPILPNGFEAALYHKAADCTAPVKEQWRRVLQRSGFDDINDRVFEDEFVKQDLVALVFIKNNAGPVGVAGVTRQNQSDRGSTLTYVGVDPARRGIGLGKSLIQMAIYQAWNAGAASVSLATHDARIPAINAYLSAGFHPCLSSWDRSHRYRWRRIGWRINTSIDFCRLSHGDARG